MRILTVNCGSSSLKVSIFECEANARPVLIASASVSDVKNIAQATMTFEAGPAKTASVEAGDHGTATRSVLARLRSEGLLGRLDAVGYRVVHGGSRYSGSVLIDSDTLRSITEATGLAPLHNGPALAAIRATREAVGDIPMVATFDTAFFHDLPAVAATYALPSRLSAQLGIRRYGFHGLAHRFMLARYRDLTGGIPGRLITLQLGSGCSAAAIKDGRPVDTSMGFTPLEGLVMGTRSGDLDPSLPGHIASSTSMSVEAVDDLLNTESGLAGMSGRGSDVRVLLEAEAAGDEASHLALEVFVYRARKYVGAYAAALGGLDGLVFGGGIGEHSAVLRQRIAGDFEWLRLSLDAARNDRPELSAGLISSELSRVKCFVIAVDEAEVIAEDTMRTLGAG